MNASISLDNLLIPLLSLSASNKKWLADRLYESAKAVETNPREGWETAAMEMRRNSDDQLLMPDVFADETMEGLEW